MNMRRPLIFLFLVAFCPTIIGLVQALETGLGSVLRPDASFSYYPDLKKRHASVPITFNQPHRLFMSNDQAQISGSFIEKGLRWLLRKSVGNGGETFGGSDEGNLNGVLFFPPLKSSTGAIAETGIGSSKSTSTIWSQSLPENPNVYRGALPNGLKYTILKNHSPEDRFEAHLEIFTGSADELDSQQGMAHLVEHVAYMGSRKREKLFGTGSQTNAYTDFHHTVFFASCPTHTPSDWGGGKNMMPLALDALCDVLEAQCESSRLEKERSAVLSEMSMVNTIEYRVECQILSALHSENQLSRRFPIGLRNLIESWKVADIKEFINTHYRPNNAMLYVVGDVVPEKVEKLIQDTFSHLRPGNKAKNILTLKSQSDHYPPVSHKWCGGKITPPVSLPVMETVDGKLIGQPRVFHHPLVQSFSLHLFAKRPVEPLLNHNDLRRSIIKRIALAVLQVRLSINSRSEPLFSSIEFNQVPSAREGCEVCYLDLTAQPSKWKKCVLVAIKEIHRLGKFGITKEELKRFRNALLTDSRQLAAQKSKISNADYMPYLMDATANGHTFMDTQQAYDATCLVAPSITVDEVNKIAKEITHHVCNFMSSNVPQPSGIVTCAPDKMQNEVDEDSVLTAIKEGIKVEIHESPSIEVPSGLMNLHSLKGEKMKDRLPEPWIPFIDQAHKKVGETEPKLSYRDPSTGILQRRLANGIHVNIKTCREEAKRGMLRIVVPGGRQLEREFGQGTVAVGARTMLEGGAFSDHKREVVELFCIDHLIAIYIDTNEEALYLDFSFPTTKLHTKEGEEGMYEPNALTGSEATMQVIHKILTGYVWEEDALDRAKMSFIHMHDTMTKSLESVSLEALLSNLSGKDGRFLFVPSKKVEGMTIDDVRKAIASQLTTDVMEISLVGDFEEFGAEYLVTQYLSTIPATSRSVSTTPDTESIPVPSGVSHEEEKNVRRHTELHLDDSDERSIAYVAGSAPNRRGKLQNGLSVVNLMNQAEGFPSSDVIKRRSHALFPYVALELLKEVVNRRLFSTVREQKGLTYDANFNITPLDRLQGSWYLMTVTANPKKAEAALQACKGALCDLSSSRPMSFDNVEGAKRVLINRHESGTRTLQYWVELMSGLQGPTVPSKDISCINDFVSVVNSVTLKDLQLLLATSFCTNQDDMFSCIGFSGSRSRILPITAVAAEP